uniref:UDP-N-acetylglucosamine diphosphorylase n=1 Tax=Meloidogyne javanica TaxID=6303 RepID=A0A915LX47_MELJA
MFRFVRFGSNSIITLKRVARLFSPDGSCGIYQTILPVLSKFQNVGVEYYICSDDNILCRVPNLQMVGCAVDKNANFNLKQFHSHRQYSSSAKDSSKKFRRFEYLRNHLFTMSTFGTLMIPLGAFVGWQIGGALSEIHSLPENQSRQHSTDAEPKSACPETVSNVQDFTLVQPDHCFDKLNFSTDELKIFYDTGLEAISKGKLAVITLTSGEESSIPNGIKSLGTGLEEENDSILFLQAAQISYLQQKAKGKIIWMIMTNKSSEEKIRKHLDIILKKTRLDGKQVFVFAQNENPAHDFDGKVLLSSPYQINTLPDGSGGIYQVLLPALPKLDSAGLEYFYVCSDNNILCRVPDLHMVGCAINKTADCVVKVAEERILPKDSTF